MIRLLLRYSCVAGEVALLESGLRTATVVAETDVTCLSLTRRCAP